LVREARLADLFIKRVWPVQRRLVSRQLYRRCTRCILNECYTTISPRSGLCSLCEQGSESAAAGEPWNGMKGELDELVRSAMRDHPDARFHALMLFSGGKDSCYMLLRLAQEFPGLRILCLSVDNTFMSPFAIDNVNMAIERSGAAHMWTRIPAELSQKMFRFALLHDDRADRMGLVDFFDGELISDIARDTAHRFGIPLVMMGLSREQVQRILGLDTFYWPQAHESKPRTEVAGIDLDEVFTKAEQRWWWRGADASAPPAQFLFPLATWEQGEEEIKRQVQESGLLEGATLDPLLTNHALIFPMVVMDYIRYGYFTYEPEFAEMIRTGRARREDWIALVEVFEYAAKTGRGLPPSFDSALHRLGLDRTTLGIPGGR
jgi:hypothetical protein